MVREIPRVLVLELSEMAPSGCLLEFLSQLSPEERRFFDGAARLTQVGKGQTVIGQGPGSTDVYFIDEGVFQVLIYSKNGKQVSIRTLTRGDCFGELAALDHGRRSANVVALISGRLVQVSGEVFTDLLKSSARAGFWLNKHFAAQIRVLTDRLFELSALNVPSRLHCELLRLGIHAGVKDNEARVVPAPTHTELANIIGTVREGVTREVGQLVKRGVLARSGPDLVIRDIAELSRLVHRAIGDHVGPIAAPD